MAHFFDFSKDIHLQQLLGAVQAGILLCDKDCLSLYANRIALAIFQHAGVEIEGKSCHQLLLSSENPCEGCPATAADQSGKRHSLTFKGQDGDIYLKVFCQQFQGQYLLTIHDVTQEIALLRRTDLDRKELLAKNILLERRRRLNAEEHEFLAQLMNNLPDSLLTVDENFLVQRKNNSVQGMFANPAADTHCYTLLGYNHPCPDCPASQGFSQVDGQKKSHELGGRFFTEIFSMAPNGRGGLLIFRDITRQVGLIEHIRANQEEIAEKNKILSLLVDFGTYLQKENDINEVADYFLDTVLPTLHSGAVALVVNDVRAGNFWVSQQRGMSEEDFKTLNKACLSRELQALKTTELIPATVLPWPKNHQIPLVGAKGQRVGLVILEGNPISEDLGFLLLVTEPLGSFFQNQLLFRQLEERANKDALTGLFNRGYLSQAMDEEKKKKEKYGIHFAVVQADINGLKKLNDQYGHECGDQMIVMASRVLQKNLRNTDLVARTGGDEFVILLGNTTDEEAGFFIKRLQNKVFEGLTLPLNDGSSFPVTVSLGKAGTDRHSVDNLLKEADRHMYAEKQKFYQVVERYR